MTIVSKPFAIHPGEILLTEFMQPLGITAYRLAKEIAVPGPRVNDIVLGKRSISADSALRLGIFFGLPAQFWLNLQNDYDLRLAKAHAAENLNIKPYKAALTTNQIGYTLHEETNAALSTYRRQSADRRG